MNRNGTGCLRSKENARARRSNRRIARALRNRIRSLRFEVFRVPEEVPAVRKLAGGAEVVAGIKRLPGLPALQCQNGIDLPTFQQLPPGLLPRNAIRHRKRKPMLDVDVAVPVLGPRACAVLRQILVPVVRHIIERVRISVAQYTLQSMIITPRYLSLPTL